MNIRKLLISANAAGIVVASMVGYFVGSDDGFKKLIGEKLEFSIFMLLLSIAYFALVEIFALKEIRRTGFFSDLTGARRPLLKIGLLRIFLVFLGGILVSSRFVLDTTFSYVSYAILVTFFVGSIFESIRFLKGGKL